MTAETTETKTLEQIVADIRERADSIPQLHSFATNNDSMALLLRSIADQIEATAKRAYNEIDSVVCGIDEASSFDIDDVRKAMESTIGEYYE